MSDQQRSRMIFFPRVGDRGCGARVTDISDGGVTLALDDGSGFYMWMGVKEWTTRLSHFLCMADLSWRPCFQQALEDNQIAEQPADCGNGLNAETP